MKNPFQELLSEAFLPNKLTRWTASVTATLTTTVLFLPPILEKLGVPEGPLYSLKVRGIFAATIMIVGLFALVVQLVSFIISNRFEISKFTEYRGSYLKRKEDGGLHDCVFCGSCRKPAAAESTAAANKYKCPCGWVSDFTVGEFKLYFPDIEAGLKRV